MGGLGGFESAFVSSWWAATIAAASLPILPAVIKAATRRIADSAGSFTYISFSDMSGLRGLFVWKQKASTDLPDTYVA